MVAAAKRCVFLAPEINCSKKREGTTTSSVVIFIGLQFAAAATQVPLFPRRWKEEKSAIKVCRRKRLAAFFSNAAFSVVFLLKIKVDDDGFFAAFWRHRFSTNFPSSSAKVLVVLVTNVNSWLSEASCCFRGSSSRCSTFVFPQINFSAAFPTTYGAGISTTDVDVESSSQWRYLAAAAAAVVNFVCVRGNFDIGLRKHPE